jgi:hypothetical protein
MFVFAGGFSPTLLVVTTSIVSSSLSSAVSSIAAPANNYGVNAGLNSESLPGQGSSGIGKKSGVGGGGRY